MNNVMLMLRESVRELIVMETTQLQKNDAYITKVYKLVADRLGLQVSTKYDRHIKFFGSQDELRMKVQAEFSDSVSGTLVYKDPAISPSSAAPVGGARSGKNYTLRFEYTPPAAADAGPPVDIFITISDPLEKLKTKKNGEMTGDFLSSGKALGYGAEHAVFAAIHVPQLGRDKLVVNIKNDARLKKYIEATEKVNNELVEKFYNNCKKMQDNLDALTSRYNVVVSDNARPPGGGTDPVDIVAIVHDPRRNNPNDRIGCNIHVKYQSDRVVGMPLPRRRTADTDTDFKNRLAGHPNKIYREVRDAIIASNKGTIDIVDIFRDKNENEKLNLRNQFYNALGTEFYELIADTLKEQLGYSDTSTGAIFINFVSTDQPPTIYDVSPGQGELFEFKCRRPETADVGHVDMPAYAFIVDAYVKDSTAVITHVFHVEAGSAKRSRGLDVHKGPNYNEFMKTIRSVRGISESVELLREFLSLGRITRNRLFIR